MGVMSWKILKNYIGLAFLLSTQVKKNRLPQILLTDDDEEVEVKKKYKTLRHLWDEIRHFCMKLY